MPFFALLLFLFPFACRQASDAELKIVDHSLADVDLSKAGSVRFAEYNYATEAAADPEILPGSPARLVDLRGRLYLPQSDSPVPLILFLHGNHATCGRVSSDGFRLDSSNHYTENGKCPADMIEAPSFRGYERAARLLASHGYAVASINANRGINGGTGFPSDPGLVHARGVLILKHIEALMRWSKEGAQVPVSSVRALHLHKRLDFSQIGLMGHSRGGEGARYAYNILERSLQRGEWRARLPGAKIRALFEIGPMDMGASVDPSLPKVDAVGIPWNVLIPGCDKDMIDYDGVHVFERMLAASDGLDKTVFTIWGANHNYFNSEWHLSDARDGCPGSQTPLWNTLLPRVRGSVAQQTILASLVSAFFRAHVGGRRESRWSHVFDPQYALPASFEALADSSREIAPKGIYLLNVDDVQGAKVKPINDYLLEDLKRIKGYWAQVAKLKQYKAIRVEMMDDPFVRPATVLQIPASEQEQVVDLEWDEIIPAASWRYLDLSLAFKVACTPWPSEPCDTVSLPAPHVELLLSDGNASTAVDLADYVNLENWNDSFFRELAFLPKGNGTAQVSYRYQPVLYQSARMELSDFRFVTGELRGLRLRFRPRKALTLVLGASNLSL